MRKITLLILILLLNGCAPRQNLMWYKSNADQTELSKTKYECMQNSRKNISGSNLQYNAVLGGYQGGQYNNVVVDDQLFNACMNANGFDLVTPIQYVMNVRQDQINAKSQISSKNDANLPSCEGNYSRQWNNCVGQVTYPNGNSYIGEFKNGMRDGKGKIRIVAIGNSDNNSIRSEVPTTYEGDFKNNRINGHGLWIQDNGIKFEGDFNNNILISKHEIK